MVDDYSILTNFGRKLTGKIEKTESKYGDKYLLPIRVCFHQSFSGWLGWAMVLGSFQCRGVLLLLHIVGQGPAVLAAGTGRVGYIFFIFFIYLPFLMSCLLGDG